MWERTNTRSVARRGRSETDKYPYDEIAATAEFGGSLKQDYAEVKERMRAVSAIGKAMGRRGLKARFVNVLGPGAMEVWAEPVRVRVAPVRPPDALIEGAY